MNELITWTELVDLVDDDPDLRFEERVEKAKPIGVADPTWYETPYRVRDARTWFAALEELRGEKRIVVDETTEALYFATADAVFEYDDRGGDGEGEAEVHLLCAHDRSRSILDHVAATFDTRGHRFVATEERVATTPEYAAGVTEEEVEQIVTDIARTSASLGGHSVFVVMGTAAAGRERRVTPLWVDTLHEDGLTNLRDGALFALALSWADPRGVALDLRRDGRRNVRSSYEERPCELWVQVDPDASATVRAVARTLARRRLAAWLVAIGASPDLLDTVGVGGRA